MKAVHELESTTGKFGRVLVVLLALVMATAMMNVPFLVSPGSAVAQPLPYDTPTENTWVTNGSVLSIANSNGTTYIGGSFTQVGPFTGQGVPIDATGTPVATYPKVNGRVYDSIPDGSGGWYIGGDFTHVGGVARNNIAHILGGGTVDPAWDPDAGNDVRALAISGTTVYAGGFFTTLQGGATARNRIAAIDANPSSPTYGNPTGWDPDANGHVYTLAISGTTVYAGGGFTTLQGGVTPRNYIAAIDDTTGIPTAWNPDADNSVWALAVSGTTVYAGGYFTTLQGGATARNRIAAIHDTTGIPTAWNPDADNGVRALAISGTTVYAGGHFTTLQGGATARNHIAAIDAATGIPTAWNPDATGVSSVRVLAISGTTVYAGGYFTQIGGQARNHIAALDDATGAATAWDPSANDTVYALAVSGTTVYAGGNFTSIGCETRNRIAAIDDATGAATAWDPNANNQVRALAVSGTTVYAGGDFTQIGVTPRNFIAAIDATGAAIPTWDPDANNQVRALAVSGTTVYAGGSFTTLQGGATARNFIAAIDDTTGNPTAWDPDANSTIMALAVSGTTVYAGGSFANIGGQPRNYIAAIDATTGLAIPTWDPDADGWVYAIAVSDATVYAGGSFTQIGGQTRNHIAAIDTTTGNATAWDPNLDQTALSLAVSGGTVYAGGGFEYIGEESRAYFAQFDTPAPAVTSIIPTSGYIGSEVTINGSDFGGNQDTSYVNFGSKQVSTYTSWGDAQIKCEVPSGISGTVQVKVTTVAGTSNGKGFTVTYPPPTVTSITPNTGANDGTVDITDLKGTNFRNGATVQLTGPSGSGESGAGTITATNVKVVSGSKITCKFNLGGATAGSYNVKVTNDDSKSDIKAGAFTVTTPNWYLAEGSTAWGYDCYITIQNPNSAAVTADITYMTTAGEVDGGTVDLPAGSQTTVNPRDTLGEVDFSTYVECNECKTIAVDRTMSWPPQGSGAGVAGDGHCSIGVTSPDTTWYLPEGSSAWGFECWHLIQNPNATPANVTLTYMIEGADPEVRTKTVDANSRATYNMAEEIGAKDAGLKVEADIPVIPERAMYKNSRQMGHDSIGTTRPATDYYLAEGTTNYGFTTYMLVQNPNDTDTNVDVTYLTTSGPVSHPDNPIAMPANSRCTIRVNDYLPGSDFSTQVTGNQSIIAERAMYWGEGTEAGEACHGSIGMDAPYTTFYLPDGQTSDEYETYTLVMNPNATDVTVEVSYLTPDGAGNVTFEETVGANSRKTFSMVDKGIGGRAAITVTCKTAGKKIMVERAMYWNTRGAGTDTIGGYSD